MTPVNATASDSAAVAGVQFTLDGPNLGAEDTGAPYSVSRPVGPPRSHPHDHAGRRRMS